LRKNVKYRFCAVVCSLSFTIVFASPVFARPGDSGKDDTSKTDTGSTGTATNNAKPADPTAAASATPMVANTKVTALLNVLVAKGVLAPAEAAEIRSAAPEAEFQLLVEALSRKGVLTASDLAAAAQPSATPERSAVASSAAAPSYLSLIHI